MTETLTAEVLDVRGLWVTVRCPFPSCGQSHTHKVLRHGRQRFAPGCGQFRSGDQRVAGYTFTTKERNR